MPKDTRGDNKSRTTEDLQCIHDLERIVILEKTHKQWYKQGVNFSIFLALALFNIIRGSKQHPSIFGVETCSLTDWGCLALFIAFCLFITVKSIKTVQHE